MSPARCPCGRPTAPGTLLCVGCERRRTPPVLPPLPPRTGRFVPAPRVEAAPPRRLPALEPLDEAYFEARLRVAKDVPCVTPKCKGTSHEGTLGRVRPPEYAGLCGSCCRAARYVREVKLAGVG